MKQNIKLAKNLIKLAKQLMNYEDCEELYNFYSNKIDELINEKRNTTNSCLKREIDMLIKKYQQSLEQIEQQRIQILDDELTNEGDIEIQKEKGKFKGIKQVNLRNLPQNGHGKSKSYWRSQKHNEDKKQYDIKRKQQQTYKRTQQNSLNDDNF